MRSGLRVLHDVGEAHHHRVGRRAGDAEAALAELPQADRHGQGQRMAGARLLLGRRDDPDVVGEGPRDRLQHLEAGGVDAVVIGEEDAHRPGYGGARGGAATILRRCRVHRRDTAWSARCRSPMTASSSSPTAASRLFFRNEGDAEFPNLIVEEKEVHANPAHHEQASDLAGQSMRTVARPRRLDGGGRFPPAGGGPLRRRHRRDAEGAGAAQRL